LMSHAAGKAFLPVVPWTEIAVQQCPLLWSSQE